MIGVSNYLGEDSYQVVRATPRALKWVEHDKLCNAKKHIAAQLHAFVTGTEAGLVNISKTKLNGKSDINRSLVHFKTYHSLTVMFGLPRQSQVSRRPV